MLVRQLEEELRIRTMQNHHPSHEVRQQVETMYAENDHLSREVAILRETVKVCLYAQMFINNPHEIPRIYKAEGPRNNNKTRNSFYIYIFFIMASISAFIHFMSVCLFCFFLLCPSFSLCVLCVPKKKQQQQQQRRNWNWGSKRRNRHSNRAMKASRNSWKCSRTRAWVSSLALCFIFCLFFFTDFWVFPSSQSKFWGVGKSNNLYTKILWSLSSLLCGPYYYPITYFLRTIII